MKAIATLAAALAVALAWVQSEGAADSHTIDPLNRVMTVAEPSNARAGPGSDYAVHAVLDPGVEVRVTGAVRDRNWLQVGLREDDGETAYIYAPLLREVAAAAGVKPVGPDWSTTENRPCRVWTNGGGHKRRGSTWSGACVDGKAWGEGRLVWRTLYGEFIYEGSMEAGKKHGRGTLIRSEGSRYVGEWRHGHRHGRGTYAWAIGHRYEGGWRNDRPHGFGIATFADGDVHEGEWRNGCYGERDGVWSALIATVDDCGFN